VHGGARAGDFAAQLDELVQQGDENPRAAIGLVAARNGWDTEAGGRIEALRALARTPDTLAEADAHLVRAVAEDNAGHGEASYQAAREALRGYAEACDPGPSQRPDCDYRNRWRATSSICCAKLPATT